MKQYVLLLCLLPVEVLTKPLPLIKKVVVTKNRIDITIDSDFKKRYLKDNFFVEYGDDIDLSKHDYSIVTLPFIMNVISLVWISGKEYEIEELDEEINESLTRIKQVFKIMYPKTDWSGKLVPKKLAKHRFASLEKPEAQQRTAFLFSGGVDSTASSLYHRDTPQLLITAWGQSALPLFDKPLWKQIKKRVTSFARQYGHENAFIKSNYYYFLDFKKLRTLSPEIVTWRTDTIEDIGWAGLIAPLLIAKGIGSLKIAASENWNVTIGSAGSPFIDANISFAGIKLYHDLFSWSRFDKVAYIVDQSNKGLIQKPQLVICQKPGTIVSCGRCEKCCLTLALLLGADADPQKYGFDVNKAEAAQRVEQHLKERESFMVMSLWEYKALQKRVQENHKERPNPYLSWLNTLDLSQKKAYTLKKGAHIFRWDELDTLFPHVRVETT